LLGYDVIEPGNNYKAGDLAYDITRSMFCEVPDCSVGCEIPDLHYTVVLRKPQPVASEPVTPRPAAVVQDQASLDNFGDLSLLVKASKHSGGLTRHGWIPMFPEPYKSVLNAVGGPDNGWWESEDYIYSDAADFLYTAFSWIDNPVDSGATWGHLANELDELTLKSPNSNTL
jgi:hypothetical protein